MARVNRFQRSGWKSPVYQCRLCAKLTRETGEGESDIELCQSCNAMAGQENAHNDDGHPGAFRDCQACKDSLRGDWNPDYKF
jgi:hypothetical protein